LPASADGVQVKPLEGTRADRSRDVVSPELALIDHAFAESARATLPKPDDTLARVELLVRANRISAARERPATAPGAAAATSEKIPEAAPARPIRPATPSQRRSHRRTAAIAGGAAAAVLAGPLLVGVRVDLQGNPAGADTASIGEPPVATTQSSRPPKVSTQVPRPTKHPRPSHPRAREATSPRRFVWAPAAGATGYHIELFRGRAPVYAADTKQPAVSIPAKWTYDGTRESLAPGDYRWYVWPLVSGLRSSQAVVQATLTVPPR